MGKTFKDSSFRDLSTVKAYNPNLISGRGKQKEAGHKETFDGTSRRTFQGRHETFLNDAKMPPKSSTKSAMKY